MRVKLRSNWSRTISRKPQKERRDAGGAAGKIPLQNSSLSLLTPDFLLLLLTFAFYPNALANSHIVRPVPHSTRVRDPCYHPAYKRSPCRKPRRPDRPKVAKRRKER